MIKKEEEKLFEKEKELKISFLYKYNREDTGRWITIIKPDLDAIEYNMDDLVSIDYSNLLAESLTFDVILNRLGLFLSQAERDVRVAELNISLAKDDYKEINATKYMHYFKELKKIVSSPTKDMIEGEIIQDEEVKLRLSALRECEFKLIEASKMRDDINSFYWTAKSKNDKLNTFTKSLKPDEFEKEIIETKINGILVRNTKPLFT